MEQTSDPDLHQGSAAQTAGWIGGLTSMTTGLTDFTDVKTTSSVDEE